MKATTLALILTAIAFLAWQFSAPAPKPAALVSTTDQEENQPQAKVTSVEPVPSSTAPTPSEATPFQGLMQTSLQATSGDVDDLVTRALDASLPDTSRKEALGQLRLIENPAAIPALTDALRLHEHSEIVDAAAHALSKTGRADALDALRAAYQEMIEVSAPSHLRDTLLSHVQRLKVTPQNSPMLAMLEMNPPDQAFHTVVAALAAQHQADLQGVPEQPEPMAPADRAEKRLP